MIPDLADELAQLYRDLDAEMERSGRTCRACGDCCRFAKHGHCLFCSEVEAEFLVAGADVPEAVTDEVCAFLQDGRCTRHDRRTLGCRTYFCDAHGDARTAGQAEAWVGRLKTLHTRFGVAWKYARLSEHLNHRKGRRDMG
ncbi:MAG TPA: hypothetical protein VMZ92_00785 [Planctomycetota bacterium]|nr:hypothetical protein [Planctomycetota bacterium]